MKAFFSAGMEPDSLDIQCKEEEGDDIIGGPNASVEICELGTEPPVPVMDAALIERETVEQLHSLSQEARR